MLNITNLNIEEIKTIAFADNSPDHYLIAIGAFFVLIILLKIFTVYVVHRFKKLAEKTQNDIDDIIVNYIHEIHWPFYVFIALYISLKLLIMPHLIDNFLNYALLIFLVFYGTIAVNVFIGYLMQKESEKRKKEHGRETSLLIVLEKIAKGVVWVIAFLLLLSNFGVNITSLVAGLGIGGIAIAFALQRVLEDVFSAFSIYFDKPFEEGDFIMVGTDMGKVKNVGLKSTRIASLQGQELIVSNKELTSSRINNYKKMDKRRVVFLIGVTYDAGLKKLKKINAIIKNIFEKIKDAELERVHFKEFGPFSLNFEIVYQVNTNDYTTYMDIQQNVNLAIVENFEKEKIEFAFPTQTVHVKK